GGAPDVKSLKSRATATATATSPVGRVLTRQLSRRSLVGRGLTRRSFADIKIKGVRAVTARATFLCLCKETWRKESTPRLRARCCAPGPRSRRDFPSGHPARAENAAHPCAAPCGSCPPPPPLRRGPGGQDQDQQQQQQQQQRYGN